MNNLDAIKILNSMIVKTKYIKKRKEVIANLLTKY